MLRKMMSFVVLVLFILIWLLISFTSTAFSHDQSDLQRSSSVSSELAVQPIIPVTNTFAFRQQDSFSTYRSRYELVHFGLALQITTTQTITYRLDSPRGRQQLPETLWTISPTVPTSPIHIFSDLLTNDLSGDHVHLEMLLEQSERYSPSNDLSGKNPDQSDQVSSLATTCIVTSVANSGPGSLRQCLLNAVSGTTITFDPSMFPPTAPVTISLTSTLPSISVNNLTIDGSQAGVILNGSGLSAGTGLVIDGADGVIIRGLQILNFPRDGIALIGGATNNLIGGDHGLGAAPLGQGNLISGNGRAGVWIQDPSTSDNRLSGNFIGTDVSGTIAMGNDLVGVAIGFQATNNLIGGDTPGSRNVIGGNDWGVIVGGAGTMSNSISGNYIGTNVNGMLALSNSSAGVRIEDQATENLIGGVTAGSRNIISGNSGWGILIGGTGTMSNTISGNYIGTDVSGTEKLGNGNAGVYIGWQATNILIGGDNATPGASCSGACNLISDNGGWGVVIFGAGTMNNLISGNYIGTKVSGTEKLGNGETGVFVGGQATNNLIGGDTARSRNIISGNGGWGVLILDTGTMSNTVTGNYIGTNVSGTAALGNGIDGVRIESKATKNLIGGETEGAGNLISGNGEDGILILGNGTNSNKVVGNKIGTNVNGTQKLGNGVWGILVADGANNVIGGDNATPGGNCTGACNLISGNGAGIDIWGTGADSNNVSGNYIGTKVNGIEKLGNGEWGLVIGFGATNNLIGGTSEANRNLISGNRIGITIQNDGTMSNTVIGNYIGTDVSGRVKLGNHLVGIGIFSKATNNIIGSEAVGARNLISGNGEEGIWIEDAGTTGNQVLGNYIGTDMSGEAPLGNGLAGIHLVDGATSNTIGVSNTIAYNGLAGVAISGASTLHNTITQNSIHHNGGLPIDFIDVPPIPTGPTLPPVLSSFECSLNTSGNTCENCRVEIFANPGIQAAGTFYLTAVIANADGQFSASLTCPDAMPYLSATATDDGTTSEFASMPGKAVFLPILMK
jgi:titin